MPTRPEEGSWEFPSIVDLYKSLSLKEGNRDAPSHKDEVAAAKKDAALIDKQPEVSNGLGDFTRIWEFLGSPQATGGHEVAKRASNTTESPTSGAPEASKAIPIKSGKLDYTSDGAIYRPPSAKGVRWRDEVEESGLENFATDSGDLLGTSPDTDTDTLMTPSKKAKKAKKEAKREKNRAKAQRKKENRRARKEAEQSRAAEKAKFLSDAESDADGLSAPARKASKHAIPTTSVREESGKRDFRSMPHRDTASEPRKVTKATAEQVKVLQELASVNGSPSKSKEKSSSVNIASATSCTHQQTPKQDKHKRVISKDTIQFTPASVKPTLADALKTKAAIPREEAESELSSSPTKHVPYYKILQKNPHLKPKISAPSTPPAVHARKKSNDFVIRYGEDRHYHFLLKLIQDFGTDRKWLVSPMQMVNHSTSPEGIHVFVDASNIFIGFFDTLKELQGIPKHERIRAPQISFDSLVLLMERRRPVAKRVLVGSLPLNPAFEKAKQVGYETNLLEQVYKDKDLSKYQKRAMYHQKTAANPQILTSSNTGSDNGNGNGNGTGTGHWAIPGSGTTTEEPPTAAAAVAAVSAALTSPPTTSPSQPLSSSPPSTLARWTEQGVDEILHLKILESVVDHSDRPTTIVLATGDAAAAEFSAGFLAMVERALRKGWRVELLAWRKGISPRYTSRAWQAQWDGRFRVIELDGYVAELLDV